MNEEIADLKKNILLHMGAIRASSQWYRPEAKRQKMAVLQACVDYLDGQHDKKALEAILKVNTNYKDSLFTKATKNLVDTVLKIPDPLVKDRIDRIKQGSETEEGYWRFPTQK